MLLTEKSSSIYIFYTLSVVMKVYPISHAIFETTRPGFAQILHHWSVLWKITRLYFFLLKPHILWIKIAQRSKIFGLLSAWVKIHIPDFKFEATCQFFFKLCITLQCHEITLLHFFSWDFILFWANQSAKFQTFHFTKFVL